MVSSPVIVLSVTKKNTGTNKHLNPAVRVSGLSKLERLGKDHKIERATYLEQITHKIPLGDTGDAIPAED
jgi:hypothetical protein